MPDQQDSEHSVAYLTSVLKRICACGDAVEWFAKQTDAEQAWRDCKRGDYMLWLIGRLVSDLPPESAERRRLTLAAARCARLSLQHVPPGEDRPRIAVELAERWGRGDNGVTLKDLRDAADAAADAADAVADAADVAAYAADAVSAAGAAAYAASAVSADCADVVRDKYPLILPLLSSRDEIVKLAMR